MEKIEEYIYKIFHIYVRTMAWTVFATACYITIFWGLDMTLDVRLLWQMMGTVLLSSTGGVLIRGSAEGLSKRKMFLKNLFGFLYVMGVILLCGLYFDWFNPYDWKMVLAMVLLIIAGYFVVCAVSFHAAVQEAERMNEKLTEQERLENQGKKEDEGI